MLAIKRACVLLASCLMLATLGATGCTKDDENTTKSGAKGNRNDSDGGADADGGADSDGGADTDGGESAAP